MNTREQHHWMDFHLAIETHATQSASIALINCNTGKTTTYQELNERANQLADYMQSKGHVSNGQLIAVMIDDDMETFIVQMLAILKSGAAFLPLQSTAEPFFLQATIVHAQPDYVLVKQPLHSSPCPQLMMPSTKQLTTCSTANPTSSQNTRPEDLAYVIYTSGSTGKPKGVMIRRRGLPYCVDAHQKTMKITPASVVAQIRPESFDAFVMEIIMALMTGASLCLIPKHCSNEEFIYYFNEHHVTHAIFVPSQLKNFQPPNFKHLQAIVVTGEPYPQELIRLWDAMGITVINGYGPTENTIVATLFIYDGEQLHAGYAIPGTEIFLLEMKDDDEDIDFTQLKPVAGCDMGEVYIGGEGLALGYRNNDADTLKHFVTITHPDTQQPIRVFRSRDLGCRAKDKGLILLGRLDFQLKVRGGRVGPEDVESEIEKCAGVKEACVIGAKKNDETYLVAFVAWDEGVINENDNQRLHELRKTLKQQAGLLRGDFMIPNAWQSLATIPKTPNGKKDRKTLQAKLATQPIPFLQAQQQQDPITPAEKCLAVLMQEVLDTNDYTIKRDDDFVLLGGTSFSATRFLTKIKESRNIDLPYAEKLNLPALEKCSSLKSLARRTSTKPLTKVKSHIKDAKLPTLFLVHSLLGEATKQYQDLIANLKNECHLYTLNAFGTKQPDNFDNNLQELVADYANAMILDGRISLTQPFVIAGWSSGGTIAYALAALLQQQGYQPAIVLIDTTFPSLDHEHVLAIYNLIIDQELATQKQEITNQLQDYFKNHDTVHFSECNKVFFNILSTYAITPSAGLRFACWLLEHEYHYTQLLQQQYPRFTKIDGTTLFTTQNAACTDWETLLNPLQKNHPAYCDDHFLIHKSSETIQAIRVVLRNIAFKTMQREFIAKVREFHGDIIEKRLLSEDEWCVDKDSYIPVTLTCNNQQVAYHEILLKNRQKQKIVLCGPSGSGKTLLTRHLAREWACNRLWSETIDCVIRLSLHTLHELSLSTNRRVLHNKTLQENALMQKLLKIIHEQYCEDEPLDALMQEALRDLILNQRVLWILDGYDEVEKLLTSHNLFAGLLKLLCEQPLVLIATRPETVSLLKADRVLNNLGFAQENDLTRYSEAFHAGKIPVHTDCLATLQANPKYAALLRTPLILEFCHILAAQGMLVDINNRASLYDKMITAILDYNWAKDLEIDALPTFADKGHIPDTLRLCLKELAYMGLQTNRSGILNAAILQEIYHRISAEYDRHVDAACVAHSAISTLLKQSKIQDKDWFVCITRCGLFNPLYRTQLDAGAHEFLHLSIQEYLAAQYCVEFYLHHLQTQTFNATQLEMDMITLNLNTFMFMAEILANKLADPHAKELSTEIEKSLLSILETKINQDADKTIFAKIIKALLYLKVEEKQIVHLLLSKALQETDHIWLKITAIELLISLGEYDIRVAQSIFPLLLSSHLFLRQIFCAQLEIMNTGTDGEVAANLYDYLNAEHVTTGSYAREAKYLQTKLYHSNHTPRLFARHPTQSTPDSSSKQNLSKNAYS